MYAENDKMLIKEIRDISINQEINTCSWIGILSKLIYRFNTIPNKTSSRCFFLRYRQSYSKAYMERQRN